jgi:hypothetical protein
MRVGLIGISCRVKQYEVSFDKVYSPSVLPVFVVEDILGKDICAESKLL